MIITETVPVALQAFADVFPDAVPVYDNLKANFTMWSELEGKHAAASCSTDPMQPPCTHNIPADA